MQKIQFGNLLDAKRGIIVHGCNAQGVMGSGVALQIKQRWPKVFQSYSTFITGFKSKNLSPLGKVDLVNVGHDLYVANAITQDDFGRDSARRYCNYAAIHEAFKYVASLAGGSIERLPVHYPLVGAGLANGDWAVISDILDDVFFRWPEVERTLWLYE